MPAQFRPYPDPWESSARPSAEDLAEATRIVDEELPRTISATELRRYRAEYIKHFANGLMLKRINAKPVAQQQRRAA